MSEAAHSETRLADRPLASMRVLAHIHSFNDADIIEGTVDAVRRQTRPPDAILIVDNASADGTLDRVFPDGVSVIRNPANLGTSGAVAIGIRHALESGFDWIWILDADSVPEPDALETLLELYESWPSHLREETGFIASIPLYQPEGEPFHGRVFTDAGRAVVAPGPEQRYYPCHVSIWSGSMYRLAAVRRIGLPNMDYVLDRGELEYGYRVKQAGYKAFIHMGSALRHNIRGVPGLAPKTFKVGSLTLKFFELAPIRCYYTCRNTLYFTIYDWQDGPLAKFRELWRVRARAHRGFMSGVAWQVGLLTLNFAVRPRTHGAQLRACLRGIWDGLTGNMTARY